MFYNSFDVARGVAAFWVMLIHFNMMVSQYFDDPTYGVLSHATTPVYFFFVLSGFLMFYLNRKHFGSPQKGVPFLLRRAGRVFPLYWIALGSMSALMLFSGTFVFPDPLEIAKHALLIRPEPINGDSGRIVGVAWSLEVEMLFYGLFGLLLFVKQAWLRWSAFLTFIVWSAFSSPIMLLFVAGAAAAYLLEKCPDVKFNTLWIVLFSAAGAVYVETINAEPLVKMLLFCGCFLILLCSLALWERTHRKTVDNLSHFVKINGQHSFTTYLFHIPIGTILLKVLLVTGFAQWLGGPLTLLVMVSVAWTCAMVIGDKIEQPMNKWVKKQIDAATQKANLR